MASLEEIRSQRLKKLELLKEAGMNGYPVSSKRDCDLAEVSEKFEKLSKKKSLTIAGRVMSLRPQGKLIFLTLDDGAGRFQGLVKADEVAESVFEQFGNSVDIGDFLEITGSLFVTKRNEKTLLVKTWRMLSKSLRPLPEKWHGLQDVEERFRHRYLDTLMSPEVKKRFLTRSAIIKEIRGFFDQNGFIEVETSMLQGIAGGTNAEPFKTRHNALDIDLYLRIAKELDLKKLLVGGFPKVYEIGRDFRNEGIDITHNPEFTMIEWYEAYSDAERQRAFVEKLFRTIVLKIFGGTSFEFDGKPIDTKEPFGVIPYYDVLRRFALLENPEKATKEGLALAAARAGVEVKPEDGREKILDAIYKKTCRPKLIFPTFIIDYPANMFPLAKRIESKPELIDAFQLVVGGMEIAKAFSELNDPVDQADRFAEQEKQRVMGDREAQATDKTYLEAMEYGMPPAGGVGIGIDRLVMLLTDAKSIKEVIMFPTMRPKN